MKVRKIKKFTGHSGPVYGLARAGTEDFFSASSDGFIASWNLDRDQALPLSIRTGIPMYSVAYLTEKELLFAGNGRGGIHVINTGKRTELKLMHLHSGYVFRIAASPEHNRWFSVSSDGTLSVNSITPLENISRHKLSERKLRDVVIDENGNRIAVISGDCTVHLFSINPFEKLDAFAAHNLSANCAAFTDDKTLVTGGRDAMLIQWDISSKPASILKEVPAHNYAIYDLELNKNRSLLISASRDKTVKVWDTGIREKPLRLDYKSGGHTHSVNKALWLSDTLFCTAGDDKSIIVWEAE